MILPQVECTLSFFNSAHLWARCLTSREAVDRYERGPRAVNTLQSDMIWSQCVLLVKASGLFADSVSATFELYQAPTVEQYLEEKDVGVHRYVTIQSFRGRGI